MSSRGGGVILLSRQNCVLAACQYAIENPMEIDDKQNIIFYNMGSSHTEGIYYFLFN